MSVSPRLTGEDPVQRTFRLKRTEDFVRVRKSGKSYAHPLVVLIAQPNDRTELKVGVVAGKAVGGAVQRNRAKRLLRAAMQSLIASVTPGWDLVLIGRAPILEADMFEVREALLTLLRRANLIASA